MVVVFRQTRTSRSASFPRSVAIATLSPTPFHAAAVMQVGNAAVDVYDDGGGGGELMSAENRRRERVLL